MPAESPELLDTQAGYGPADDQPLDLGRCLRRSCRSWRRGASARRGTRGCSRTPPRIWMACSVTHTATSPAFSFDIEPSPAVNGTPLRAIQAARHTSRRAASISVRMSASLKAMPWFMMIGLPKAVALLGVLAARTRRRPGRCRAPGRRRPGGWPRRWPSPAASRPVRPRLAGPGQLLVELLLAAEQAAAGHPHVVEDHLGGVRGPDARASRTSAPATGPCVPRRHDEAGLAAALQRGVDGGHDHVHVGDAAVGDPRLGAVEHPLVGGLVVDGPGAQRRHVGAGVGLADTQNAPSFTSSAVP